MSEGLCKLQGDKCEQLGIKKKNGAPGKSKQKAFYHSSEPLMKKKKMAISVFLIVTSQGRE